MLIDIQERAKQLRLSSISRKKLWEEINLVWENRKHCIDRWNEEIIEKHEKDIQKLEGWIAETSNAEKIKQWRGYIEDKRDEIENRKRWLDGS
jgi:hypothetical protein